jgi:hypothetical protein
MLREPAFQQMDSLLTPKAFNMLRNGSMALPFWITAGVSATTGDPLTYTDTSLSAKAASVEIKRLKHRMQKIRL